MSPIHEPRSPREPVSSEGTRFDLILLVLLAVLTLGVLLQSEVFGALAEAQPREAPLARR